MKQLTPGEALNKAAAYCTLCERCISEVSAKLTAWDVPYSAQRKAKPKNAQTTAQLHSSHMLVKSCSKFSKPAFSNT